MYYPGGMKAQQWALFRDICPFRLETKQFHVIIHTLSPSLPAYAHTSPPAIFTFMQADTQSSYVPDAPKTIQNLTMLPVFKDTPCIHLTIIHSVLSKLCRFATFIANVSVPYVDALWALYILPFMWYTPWASEWEKAHSSSSCCLHTFSCTKSVTQITEFGRHIPALHWVQSQPLSAILIRLGFSPNISYSGNQHYFSTSLRCHYIFYIMNPPKTLFAHELWL